VIDVCRQMSRLAFIVLATPRVRCRMYSWPVLDSHAPAVEQQVSAGRRGTSINGGAGDGTRAGPIAHIRGLSSRNGSFFSISILPWSIESQGAFWRPSADDHQETGLSSASGFCHGLLKLTKSSGNTCRKFLSMPEIGGRLSIS
jgi:hypothetical protein